MKSDKPGNKKDQEIMEFAARAAGATITGMRDNMPIYGMPAEEYEYFATYTEWNPLEDDGDAFRLAVSLEMQLRLRHSDNEVIVYASRGVITESVRDDPYTATRRAITRAAAAIGRAQQ